MGLRGVGAKPVRKSDAWGRHRRRRWENPRLSRAEKVIAFVESLKLTAGDHAGKPFRLRDWQKTIIRGIYRTRARRRLVRTAVITMARKNGKTQLASALALAHLLGPEAEPRGEVYSAASDRNQASRVFRELEAMILADLDLKGRCNIQRFAKKIEVLSGRGAGSHYEALSSDARKAHSLSPSFVVADELAQWKDRELYDTLTTGGGARREPLVAVISTRTSDRTHVMSELVFYGEQVRDGILEDPTFSAHIFTTPADADPWDEAAWYAANPALGDFRSLEEIRTFATRAKRLPSLERVFRGLYLNQPVDPDARFIAAADWDACAGSVNAEALRGHPCWAGLDLGSTNDLTALVLYFPEDGGAVVPYFWVPRDRLDERERTDRVPYRTWHQQGLIEAPEGRAVDRLAIARRLAEIASTFDLKGVAYDRWRIEDLKKLLSDEGIELPLVAFGQGFRDQGPAVDALETAVLGLKIVHPAHPVLDWNLANAVVQTDPAGNRKMDKERAIERVDGLVALVMAVGLHTRTPAPAKEQSVYETRGLLVVG